jgi:Tfp pilus assembly protein PilF
MMDRIAKLKELLTAHPQDSFLQHALALEWVKQGDDTAARALFEEILHRDQNYIGSYYHLAKLLERQSEKDAAISWYELGMIKAKEAGDQHAYQELMNAYEDLVY